MDNMGFDLFESMFDSEFSDMGLTASIPEKKDEKKKSDSTKKKSDSKSKKASGTPAEKVSVTLPVTFIAEGYRMEIPALSDGSTTGTLQQLADTLVTSYDVYQLKVNGVKLVYSDSLRQVVMVLPSATDDAVITYPVTICWGRESECVEANEDCDMVSELVAYFSERLACKMFDTIYDPVTGVVALTASGSRLMDGDITKNYSDTPISINVDGVPQTYEEKTVKALSAAIIGDMEDVSVSYHKCGEHYIFVPASSKGNTVSVKDYVLHEGAKLDTAVRYTLPLSIVLSNVGNRTIEVTEEQIGAKYAVADDLEKIIRSSDYKMLFSGRKLEFLYLKNEGTVYAQVQSGKLGSVAVSVPTSGLFTQRKALLESLTAGSSFNKFDVGSYFSIVTRKCGSHNAFEEVFDVIINQTIPVEVLSIVYGYFSGSVNERAVTLIELEDGDIEIRFSDDDSTSPVSINYQFPLLKKGERVLMQLHSHPVSPAIFSGVDNRDQVFPCIYAVIGKRNQRPEISLRAGYGGSFYPLRCEEVFDAPFESILG